MSKETKFTKGEWSVEKVLSMSLGGYYHGKFEVKSNEFIGSIEGQGVANAHLIKTAPKLYEVIESDIEELKLRLAHLYKRSQEYEKVIDEIYQKESLLAEARGEL